MKVTKPLLLLLLAGILVFTCASCKKEEENPPAQTTEEPVADVSFFDYTVIRPASASDALQTSISEFYGRLLAASGQSNLYETDAASEADSDRKEILIGRTNRPESEQALAQLSGSEYIVTVTGNKIVITGLSDVTTGEALRYFADAYLSGEPTGQLAENLLYKDTADDLAEVVANGKVNYTLVCKESDKTANDQTGRIYNTLRGLSSAAVTTAFDSAAADPDARQILIGYTDYEETATVAAATQPEGYSIDFVGNKIVVFAWKTATWCAPPTPSWSCWRPPISRIPTAMPPCCCQPKSWAATPATSAFTRTCRRRWTALRWNAFMTPATTP